MVKYYMDLTKRKCLYEEILYITNKKIINIRICRKIPQKFKILLCGK